MSKIHRLESLVSGDQGGSVGEAIRACNRRLDDHKARMDVFYARIRTQDWYHDLSEGESEEETQRSTRTRGPDANAENQPGVANRPCRRPRLRGQAPQRVWQRAMPRPPPPPSQSRNSEESMTLTPEMIQQGMQRLFAAYNQCVTRVAQTDDRFEQFRSIIRRDAIELTLTVQRNAHMTGPPRTMYRANEAHVV